MNWMEIAKTARGGQIFQRDGKCFNFSGWEGEEVRCERIPGHGEHDGGCLFPVRPYQHTEEEIMDSFLEKIVKMFEAQLEITQALIAEMKLHLAELKNTAPVKKETPPEQPAVKPEPAKVEQPATPAVVTPAVSTEPKPHSEGGALTVRDVTIEMIREMAATYSDAKNFGMDAWLALAQKVTGVRKVKEIPKELYGVFHGAMSDGLAKLVTDRALKAPSLPAHPGNGATASEAPAASKTAEITLEQLREKAKEFIAANGQPALVALVKVFGATKISEIAKEKYPAFLEAISNA